MNIALKYVHKEGTATTTAAEVTLRKPSINLIVANKDTTNNVEFSFDGVTYFPVFPKTSQIVPDGRFNKLYVKSSAGSVAYSILLQEV